MKSSALTGTPSDHTARGLITYWMVEGQTLIDLDALQQVGC